MKDSQKQKRRRKPRKNAFGKANTRRKAPGSSASKDRPMSSYSPKEREKIRRGIRILARMIVRAHMRRNAPTALAEQEGGGEE